MVKIFVSIALIGLGILLLFIKSTPRIPEKEDFLERSGRYNKNIFGISLIVSGLIILIRS
jgi:hypothetical protein